MKAGVIDNTPGRYKILVPHHVNVLVRQLHADFPNKEWSAIGKLEKDEENKQYILTDIAFGEQHNSASLTEFTEEWYDSVIEWIVENDMENMHCWNCWIHSHNSMWLFWSGTDDECKQSYDDWEITHMFHIVTNYDNKTGQVEPWYKTALTFYQPTNIEYEGEVVIEEREVSDKEAKSTKQRKEKSKEFEAQIEAIKNREAPNQDVDLSHIYDVLMWWENHEDIIMQDFIAKQERDIELVQDKINKYMELLKRRVVSSEEIEWINDKSAWLKKCDKPRPAQNNWRWYTPGKNKNTYGSNYWDSYNDMPSGHNVIQYYKNLIPNEEQREIKLFQLIKQWVRRALNQNKKDKMWCSNREFVFNDKERTIQRESLVYPVPHSPEAFIKLFVSQYENKSYWFTCQQLFGKKTTKKIKSFSSAPSNTERKEVNSTEYDARGDCLIGLEELKLFWHMQEKDKFGEMSGSVHLNNPVSFITKSMADIDLFALSKYNTELECVYDPNEDDYSIQLTYPSGTVSEKMNCTQFINSKKHMIPLGTILSNTEQRYIYSVVNEEEPSKSSSMSGDIDAFMYVDYILQETDIKEVVKILKGRIKQIEKQIKEAYGRSISITNIYETGGDEIYLNIENRNEATYQTYEIEDFFEEYNIDMSKVLPDDIVDAVLLSWLDAFEEETEIVEWVVA